MLWFFEQLLKVSDPLAVTIDYNDLPSVEPPLLVDEVFHEGLELFDWTSLLD